MWQMNPYALSGILICLTFFPLFFFTWLKGQTKVARYFSYHLLSVGLWGLGTILVGLNHDPEAVYRIWNVAYCIVLFIPVFLVHSILIMTNKLTRLLLLLTYGQAILFVITTLLGLTFPGIKFMFNSLYYNQGGRLYLASIVIWLWLVFFAHTLLLNHYVICFPKKKKQISLLMLAIPLGFGGGLTNFLPGLGIDLYPIGNFLIPFYSMIVAYAIFQYQFLEITYVLRKGLTFIILISIISTMYFVAILLLEPIFKKLLGFESFIPGILAALFLGFIFAPLRMKVEYLVNRAFFKESFQEMVRQNELLRQELIRSEKFRMVSSIARGIVYEIRNPITSIKALSQHIFKKSENKDFVETSSLSIDRQVERINNLLEQLLKFSNLSAPEFKLTSIQMVIEDVLGILQREFSERDIKLIKQFQTFNGEVLKADSGQLRQALYNIMFYAIESMPNGGTLTLTTGIKPFSEIIQKNFDPTIQDFFEMTIHDTSLGIPKENLPYIFDPFFNPGENRLSLSLSIAHKIIKEHSGNIIVESEVNKGTTFIVELPRTR